jgi:hypothetical protein
VVLWLTVRQPSPPAPEPPRAPAADNRIAVKESEKPAPAPEKTIPPKKSPLTAPAPAARPEIQFSEPPAVAATGGVPVLPNRSVALPPPPEENIRARVQPAFTAAEWAELQQSCNPESLRDFARRYRTDPVAARAINLAGQCEARERARRDVLAILDAYAGAYNRKSLPELSAVYVLSEEQRRTIRRNFSGVSRIKLQLWPGPVEFAEPLSPDFAGPEFTPSTARVRVRKRIDTVTDTGEKPHAETTETAVLKRTGQSWKITSFE